MTGRGTAVRGGAAPDVAIIGGGIIGTAMAADLAARGVRVTLYEIGPAVASAASGRNAGLIIEPPDPVMAALHRESLRRYRDLVGEPTGPDPEDAFRIPPAMIGVLGVSFDHDLVARVAAAIAADPLEAADLREVEPLAAEGLAAVELSTGYPVRPADATRALAGVATRAGAAIVTECAARPWIVDGVARGVILEDGRRVEAGTVVVAAGPWTSELVDPSGAWRPVRAMWGVLVEMALDPAPRTVLEELTGDGSMLLSAASESEEEGIPPPLFTMNPAPLRPGGVPLPTGLGNTLALAEPDPRRVAPALIAHGRQFVPTLHERQMAGVRSCPRPLSFDGRPLVGHVAGVERLVVAAGNGAWGISTGPATARLAAEAVIAGSDAGVPAELVAGRAGGVAVTGR